MKLLSVLSSLFLLVSFSHAQQVIPCYTDEMRQELLKQHPEYAEDYRDFDHLVEDYRKNTHKTAKALHTIPVVFHIIYNNEIDNISKAQILDGLRVLNEDFRRQNADASNTRAVFQPVAADAEIEFVLASQDPNGDCTDGITRTRSPLTIDAHNNVKSLVSWNNSKYLNIWVVRSIAGGSGSGIVLGYSYLPRPNQSATFDGIVIRHDHVGTIGTGSGVSRGRTLTHEAGHYLGLNHTFEDGCSINGDNCADTPPVFAASFGCNFNANTCSSDSPDLVDMIENYMDYSDDQCQNMFSQDQKTIMKAALGASFLRGTLVTSSNLAATGVSLNPTPVCAPVANFSSSTVLVCEGESVDFSEKAYNGTPTTWNWSFQGGTPATSSVQNPTVQYLNSGTYDVQLTVSNSSGSSSVQIQKKIYVRPATAPYANSIYEGFEIRPIPSYNTAVIDLGDGITWQRTSDASYSGTYSAMIDNFNNASGDVDALISPNIDISASLTSLLTFKYAYARRISDNTDYMRVYVSTDCGENWILRRHISTTNLITAVAPASLPFVPSGTNDWKESQVDLSPYISSGTNILLKFEFNSGGGNNIYLDDIQLNATVGVDELQEEIAEMTIVPHPATVQSYLKLELPRSKELKLKLINSVGEELVELQALQSFTAGMHELPLQFPSNMTNGLYFIVLESEGNVLHEKLIYSR